MANAEKLSKRREAVSKRIYHLLTRAKTYEYKRSQWRRKIWWNARLVVKMTTKLLKMKQTTSEIGGGNEKIFQKIIKQLTCFLHMQGLKVFDTDSASEFLHTHRTWNKRSFNKRLQCLFAFENKHKKSITSKLEAMSHKKKTINADELIKYSQTSLQTMVKQLDKYPTLLKLPHKAVVGYLKNSHIRVNPRNKARLQAVWMRNVAFRKSVQQLYSCTTEMSDSSPAHDDVQSYNLVSSPGKHKVWCICQKEYKGELMVQCESCRKWYHPQCVFNRSSPLSLTSKQWEKRRVVCPETEVSAKVDSSMVYRHYNFKSDTNTELCALENDSYGNVPTGISESDGNATTVTTSESSSFQDTCKETNLEMNFIKQANSSENSSLSEDLPDCEENFDPAALSQNGDCDENWIRNETAADLEKMSDVVKTNYRPVENVDQYHIATISLEDWKSMCKNRRKHYFHGGRYREIILKKLHKAYSGCVPCVRSHYLRDPENTMAVDPSDDCHLEGFIDIYCSHKKCCKCCCKCVVTLWSYEDRVEATFKIDGRRRHKHNCVRRRRVTGAFREKLRRKLRSQSATKQYRELLNKLTDEERCLGARTYLPSQSVLRNIKSENYLWHRYTKSWILNLDLFRKKLFKEGKQFVRSFSVHPPSVSLYTKGQISLYNDLAAKDILYFDATGSVLRRHEGYSDFQVYTLLARNPRDSGVCLPIATNITTCHDGTSISHFLENFLLHHLRQCKKAKKPSLMIIDGSLAMWNAVLNAMCSESRIQYYNRCFRIVNGMPLSTDMKKTVVCNCYSHAMKAAKILCNKYYTSKHRKEGLYWINLLFSCSTLTELDEAVASFFVVTNCEATSSVVENHFEKLKNWKEQDLDQTEQTEPGFTLEQDKDYILCPKRLDEEQEKESPFLKRYQSQLDKFFASTLYQKHLMKDKTPTNPYCKKEFCDKVLQIILGRIATTSKLMLGNLSRHANSSSSSTQVNLYNEYNKKCSMLEKSEFQTILTNNRTQGIVEQHFKDMKENYLNGKRLVRMDDFVVRYHEAILLQEKQYVDCFKHSKSPKKCRNSRFNPYPKPDNSSNVLESTFKKRRRHVTSYYASPHCAAKLKFKKATYSRTNKDSLDEMLCTHIPTRFLVFPDSAEVEIVKPLVLHIWRGIPFTKAKIWQTALITQNGRKISYRDLCSVCPNPRGKTYSALIGNGHDSETVGWLTENVVDCYTARTVDVCNKMCTSTKFGYLDCCDVKAILEGRKYRHPAKSFSRMTSESGKHLRDIVFMPVLWDKHYLLLWYSKEKNELTVLNSLQSCDADLFQAIQDKVLDVFTLFDTAKPQLKTGHIVMQRDAKSCGVCVCYAVDNIATGVLDVYQSDFRSADNRMWIVYSLVQDSFKCHRFIKDYVQNHNITKIGLPNFSQNCWFNAVLQAVQSLFTPEAISRDTVNDAEPTVESIVANLVHNIQTNETLMEQVIDTVCKKLKFHSSLQQDATEFYMLINLDVFLDCNNRSPYFLLDTRIACSACNVISTTTGDRQSVYTLSPFDDISENCLLSDHFQRDLTRQPACSKCSHCSSTATLRRYSLFASAPEILCVILWRCGNVGVKNMKRVIPDRTLSVAKRQGGATYELKSMVVHVGPHSKSGHYVAYGFDKYGIMEYDDTKVSRVSWSAIADRVATGGCIYFYAKIGEDQVAESETDSSQSERSSSELKVIKKKRRRPLPPMEVYERIEFEPVVFLYTYPGRELSQSIQVADLDDDIRKTYQSVSATLVKCMNMSLSSARSIDYGYRHCLFLNKEKKRLQIYNSKFFLAKHVTDRECLNLWSFVRHVLTLKKVNLLHHADGYVTRAIPLGTYFNRALLQSSPLSDTDVADYLKHVANYEALIFCVMEEGNVSYASAAAQFGCEVTTYESESKEV